MNRRTFLRNGSFTGVPAVLLADASGAVPEPADHDTISKGDFRDGFPLNELTIDDLQKKMEQGETSSRELTELYLSRIQAVDQAGPGINAVIELNPEALAIAEAMDGERKAGKRRGPLHGIPLLIKDNINTGDRMMTTAGALALAGNVAAQDAFIVKRLREAGAVLLGKTNLSEWANFRSTRSSSGWSTRGGQTKNPYVLDRSPCGSSSGSGAAVAGNLCAVAIGTETDGSITAPASFCGIVGLKPTVGLWSRSGIIPISATQDTAGPMTRTVRDAAILLGALAGEDEADPATVVGRAGSRVDYTTYLKADALKGRRIGVEKSFFHGNEAVVTLYQEAIAVLKQLGAEVVEVELLKLIRPLSGAESIVLEYEFKDGVNRYLSQSNAAVRSLAGVIAFNQQHETETMPYFRQELLESSQARGDLMDPEYQEALKRSTSARQIIDDLMKRLRLEAICSTSMGLANCIDLVNGDYSSGFYFAPPAAMAGYPHITVPMGQVHQLPVGLSFIAGAWQEGVLLGFAYAYEQASNKRASPKFSSTLR